MEMLLLRYTYIIFFLNWKYDGKGAKNNTHPHTHAKVYDAKRKVKKKESFSCKHLWVIA